MISYEDELYHHGIKGQKWGVRRYQNADGSLTAAGEKRYGSDSSNSATPFLRDKTRAIGKKVSNAGQKVAGGVDRAAEKVYNHRVARNERLRKMAAEYKSAHAKAVSDREKAAAAEDEEIERYQALGKNNRAREREIKMYQKGKSSNEAVKNYTAAYEKTIQLIADADKSDAEMRAKYNELGRTKLTRFIRYQTFKPRG